MVQYILIVGMLVPAQAVDDAATLLASLGKKARSARSLRVRVEIEFSESGPLRRIGVVEACVKGPNLWRIQLTPTRVDGLEDPFWAVCDGKRVALQGFESKRDAHLPERFTEQLRDWCSTSLMPVFMSLAYRRIDQGDDNRPKVSSARSLGRENVAGADARMVEYLLSYPTQTQVQVKAWIDPVRLLPLKRTIDSRSGRGGGFMETIASFEIDPDLPDSTFAEPVPTEADRMLGRLKEVGRDQLRILREALEVFQEDAGRYPTTEEGLVALLRKPGKVEIWKGPYLDGAAIPPDPWGNAFGYRSPGAQGPDSYDLSSPDFPGKFGLPLEKIKELLAEEIRMDGIVDALKALAQAQVDFRSQDRDGNGTLDYWVGDVAGLYRLPAGGAELRLIDRRLAEADAVPIKASEGGKDWPAKPVPFRGYVFAALSRYHEDDLLLPYDAGGFRNRERFALAAFPADPPKSGRLTFIVDQKLRVFARDLDGKRVDAWPVDAEFRLWRSAGLAPAAPPVVLPPPGDASRVEANERNAASILRTFASAEADFRANDRDGNGKRDFWVADLSGLWRLEAGGAIRLIENAAVLADARPCVPLDRAGLLPGTTTKLVAAGAPQPRSGYWFAAIGKAQVDNGTVEAVDKGEGRSPSNFCFCAYPSAYGQTGRLTFILDARNTVWKKDTGGKPVDVFPLQPRDEGWLTQD